MTTQTHSPLPWKPVRHSERNEVLLSDAENNVFAEGLDVENAQLIVTAVNSHSALVSALEGLINAVEQAPCNTRKALAAASQVLAQVKGGKPSV